MAINITGFEDDEPPLTGLLGSGAVTDDSSPRVQGTISAPLDVSESVAVLRNDVVLGAAHVTGTNWTYQDSGLANGTYTYTAQVLNAAGTPTAVSGALAVTVSAPPAQIVTITTVMENRFLPGLILDGGWTDDDTPTFQGTLSAPLARGQSVHIFRNSVDVGMARVSGTNWDFEDGGLQSGQTYTYMARVVDRQGSMGPESEPISFTLNIGDPVIAIEHIVDNVLPVVGDILNNGVTNDTSPWLVGSLLRRLGASEKVEVLRDGEVVGTATMISNTTWSYQDDGLTNGTHSYMAQIVDAAGTPMGASKLVTITVDTAPAQIVTIMAVQDNIAPVVGLIAEGDTTNDDTPTLQGKLSAALSSGQSVHVFRNGVDAGTARVDGTNWVFEDGGLQSGMTYTYTVRVVDRQGSVGPESDSVTFTLDTSDTQWPIAIEHIVDDVLPVVGDIPNNGVTNDTAPRLTGSLVTRLSAGQKVELVRDGEVVGTATMTGKTTWSYQDSGLANGHDYTYTARVVDAHGVQIAESAAWKIAVDIVIVEPPKAPVIASFVDDQSPHTGESQTAGSLTYDVWHNAGQGASTIADLLIQQGVHVIS